MSLTQLNEFESSHLLHSERVKQGSFYTPKKIVDEVHKLILPYKDHPKAVIFDSSAGGGAFIRWEEKAIYKAVEFDPVAGAFLKNKLPEKNLFIENSILNVSREKYGISPSDFLIQIGNPPYNDVTSAYRKGKKGENICDKDLFDRDLGISFLKSYNKLCSDVVCVLHPLSYLIKPANFKRLKPFSENYRLKKGLLFSSALFQNVSSTHFPITIALYEKNSKGMTDEYIKSFKFSILNDNGIFKLKNYASLDPFIRKYPPRKTDIQSSNIGVYYHAFRDINSLIRNRGFHIKKNPYSIVVHLEDLYKYAYLFAFKKLFRPKDLWLYGNLSPLGHKELIEKNKSWLIKWLFCFEPKLFAQLSDKTVAKIFKFYSIKKSSLKNRETIKEFVFQLVKKSLFQLAESNPKNCQRIFSNSLSQKGISLE